MTVINDLYRQLFGRSGTNKGTDVEMSEHGRVGGLSTGQPFKHSSIVDKDDGSYLKVRANGSINAYASPFGTWVSSQVTLTDANTVYLLPATEQEGRQVLVVYNSSDTSIYFGGSSVVTTNGILLTAGSTLTIDAEAGIYAVCGTAGKTINILEGK